MPTSLPIQISPPVFAEGYCPSSEQQRANDIASGLSAVLPGNYIVWNYGSTVPTVEDQDKPWHRLNEDGSPDKDYDFFNGQWVSAHPIPANSGERRFFLGTEAQVWAHDGGDGDDPASTTPHDGVGAMWEVDHTMDGRVALGAGTLPTSSTAVATGVTGGADQVTPSIEQMPRHSHALAHNGDAHDVSVPLTNATQYIAWKGIGAVDSDHRYALAQSIDNAAANIGKTGETGGNPSDPADPIDIMPPYKAGFWIKRTARKYYTLP